MMIALKIAVDDADLLVELGAGQGRAVRDGVLDLGRQHVDVDALVRIDDDLVDQLVGFDRVRDQRREGLDEQLLRCAQRDERRRIGRGQGRLERAHHLEVTTADLDRVAGRHVM